MGYNFVADNTGQPSFV